MSKVITQTAQASGSIRFRLVLAEDGSIGFFTESGTFEAGNDQVEKLLKELGAAGISFKDQGVPEQHRHDEDPEMVLSDAHQLSHASE